MSQLSIQLSDQKERIKSKVEELLYQNKLEQLVEIISQPSSFLFSDSIDVVYYAAETLKNKKITKLLVGFGFGHDEINYDLESIVTSRDFKQLSIIVTLKGVDYIDNYRRTLLYYAIIHGYKDIVEFLVEKGASIVFTDELEKEHDVLFDAHSYKKYEICKYLIKCDVNTKSSFSTALRILYKNHIDSYESRSKYPDSFILISYYLDKFDESLELVIEENIVNSKCMIALYTLLPENSILHLIESGKIDLEIFVEAYDLLSSDDVKSKIKDYIERVRVILNDSWFNFTFLKNFQSTVKFIIEIVVESVV